MSVPREKEERFSRRLAKHLVPGECHLFTATSSSSSSYPSFFPDRYNLSLYVFQCPFCTQSPLVCADPQEAMLSKVALWKEFLQSVERESSLPRAL